MRKFLLCFLVILAMFCLYNHSQKPLFTGVDGVYTFYLGSKSSNAQIVTVDASKAEKTKNLLKDVEGESVAFSSDFGYETEVIKRYNAVEVKREIVNFTTNVYYYSYNIPYFVLVGGKKVNLHVAYSKDITSVGIPFIFGSY